ncbi:TerB family tellurite resistance protein [Yinghuangia sp. ASG 101]|uniref:TerB family tellurite resistance protein n=1 Tax=Yinghuangia sp. ASG 101 TaxID=2896848 RepID=UPI001E3B7888|nr:TerB family tellurite resistance protein [Yinghuangia sp. ASG 101]UGQ09859.1 TerB family tellurite resistance protein [Yinghuangia sp. ASG 101]
MVLIVGVRNLRKVLEAGEFHCPECGGDRRFQFGVGRRHLIVCDIPVLPLSRAPGSVECAVCGRTFDRSVLDVPTGRRLTELLRDVTRTLVIGALVAGGESAPSARAAAVAAVRGVGMPAYDDEMLSIDLYAYGDDEFLDALPTLDTLAAHLAHEGRVRLITVAAHVALADGPYRTLELDMLLSAGARLGLTRAEADRALDEAAGHTPR